MTELETLQSENKSLKDVVARFQAENTALKQSYREEIEKKDQLRTLAVHYETIIPQRDTEITELKAKLAEFTKPHLVEENVA